MKDKKKNIPPMTFGPGTLQKQKQEKAIKEFRKGSKDVEKTPLEPKKKAVKKSAVEETTPAVPLLGKHPLVLFKTFEKGKAWCYNDDYLEALNNAYPPDLFKEAILTRMERLYYHEDLLDTLVDIGGIQYPGWTEANFAGRVNYAIGALLVAMGTTRLWSGLEGSKDDTANKEAIAVLERNGLALLLDHEGETYLLPTFTLVELVFRNAAKNGLLKPITSRQTI
jgi:hypothetical protein